MGNIQRYACAGFIHRDGCRAIARQPFEVAQRLAHGFADNDAGIFRRVVKINMQIALSRNFQVDQGVTRQLLKHVVEKANAGRHS